MFSEYGLEILGIGKSAFLRNDLGAFAGFPQQNDSFLKEVPGQLFLKTDLDLFLEFADQKGFTVMQLSGQVVQGELFCVMLLDMG